MLASLGLHHGYVPGEFSGRAENAGHAGRIHLAVWILTVLGVARLFSAARTRKSPWSGQTSLGAMIAGWGGFNRGEGLDDGQLLGIDQVLPGHPSQLLFDLLFLAFGGLLVLLGVAFVRMASRRRNASNV